MDLTLSNDALNITEWILSVGAVVLPGLLVLALTALLGRVTIRQLVRLWRPLSDDVVPAMDDATDPLVVLLATLVKGNPAEVARVTRRAGQFIVSVLNAVADQLDESDTEAKREAVR